MVQPETYPPFESLDRLATIEMRPPTSPSGILGAFYELARDGRPTPISRDIGYALAERSDLSTLIVTGLVEEGRFPRGEIDGPIGSIALARALSSLGGKVTIVIDPEAAAPVRAILDAARLDRVRLRIADFTSADEARAFGATFATVIAVEKLGRNARGGRHLIWGTPVHVGDAFADDYIEGAAAAGGLTIGVGDNGNEIGFGNIADTAHALTPHGVEVDGGFFAHTKVDHLLPASISNIGCYVIAASLAIASRRGDLAVDGETVRSWTELGLDVGLRSGGVDDPAFRGDDGVPVPFIAAHAEMIRGVVHQALLGDSWVAPVA